MVSVAPAKLANLPAMRSFEYVCVETSSAESGSEDAKAEAAAKVHKDWLDLLNARGEHGWSWSRSTMKRQRD